MTNLKIKSMVRFRVKYYLNIGNHLIMFDGCLFDLNTFDGCLVDDGYTPMSNKSKITLLSQTVLAFLNAGSTYLDHWKFKNMVFGSWMVYFVRKKM